MLDDLYLPQLPEGYRWKITPEDKHTLRLKLQRRLAPSAGLFANLNLLYSTEDSTTSPAPSNSSQWRAQIHDKARRMVLKLNGHHDLESVKSRLSR